MTPEHQPKKQYTSVPYVIGGAVMIPLSLVLTIAYTAINVKASVEAHEKTIACIEKRITDNDLKDQLQQESIIRTVVVLEQIGKDIKEIKENMKK